MSEEKRQRSCLPNYWSRITEHRDEGKVTWAAGWGGRVVSGGMMPVSGGQWRAAIQQARTLIRERAR